MIKFLRTWAKLVFKGTCALISLLMIIKLFMFLVELGSRVVYIRYAIGVFAFICLATAIGFMVEEIRIKD